VEIPRLREWREARGESQVTLAERSGVAEHTISRIESGYSSRPTTARKLADALDIAVVDLLESPPALASLGKVPAPPSESGPAPPSESGPTEAERIHELRSWAEFFRRFAKRWSEETQEHLAEGHGPIYWGLEKQCAAMSLVQTALEVPSIGERDAVEVGLSREEQQAKLELSRATDELFRAADAAYEAQTSLAEDDAGIPAGLIATQKGHLAALKSSA
jgi:transcriptional regulator with XRE-family HTH domain